MDFKSIKTKQNKTNKIGQILETQIGEKESPCHLCKSRE
jgi:hypothetical protein